MLPTRVLANRLLPPDAAVLEVEWPPSAHASAAGALDATRPSPEPFSFCMLSAPSDARFPFLPRPFSIYDARPGVLSFLVKAVGPGTRSLAALRAGDPITVAGPLGKALGPAARDGRRSVAVAGGVGIAPFLLLYRRWLEGAVAGLPSPGGAERPLLLFGGRTRAMLYDLELFEALPIEVRTSTEDGSHGVAGRVMALVEAALAEGPCDVLCCGPDPMMEAVAAVCARTSTPCRLSLETFMACGYGVCNACAVPVRDDRYSGGIRYDRCCLDGPVFEARDLVHEHG